jgi:hypothetical protein
MRLRDLLDNRVVEEQRGVGSNLHVALDEALRAERGVRGHLDAVLFGELDEVGLDVVRVMLNLKRSGLGLCICEHVQQQRAAVVADTDALGQSLALELLECLPCAL